MSLHVINSALSDDQDITKQTRSLYTKANILIHKFSHASLNTKLMLFRAYCTPIYGCQYSYSKLRVASDSYYMKQDGVFHNVSSFTEIIGKLVYLLLCSQKVRDFHCHQTFVWDTMRGFLCLHNQPTSQDNAVALPYTQWQTTVHVSLMRIKFKIRFN